MTKAIMTAFLSVMMAAGVSGTAPTPEAQRTTGSYTWSAELVAADASAAALTFRARVAYPAAFAAAQQLTPGDAIRLVWSGADDTADAIREVRKADGRVSAEPFSLAGVLLATDAASQYVTVRVDAPSSGLSAIQHLKPGEWITVTARHQPRAGERAVLAVRPYNMLPAATT